MTKPLANGVVADRTYSDLEEASLRNLNRLKRVLMDLRDGDNDTSEAFDLALQMYEDEALRLRIYGMLIHKRLSEAETAAMQLAAANRETAK